MKQTKPKENQRQKKKEQTFTWEILSLYSGNKVIIPLIVVLVVVVAAASVAEPSNNIHSKNITVAVNYLSAKEIVGLSQGSDLFFWPTAVAHLVTSGRKRMVVSTGDIY